MTTIIIDRHIIVMAWHPKLWSKRVMAIMLERVVLVNIYASNQHKEREELFRAMAEWLGRVLRDFNCVQSPYLDRLGGTRSGHPDSAALQDLLLILQLEDARI